MDDLAKLKEAETWHERLRRLVVAKDYAGALELLRHPAPGTETDAVYEERQRAQAVINGRDRWIVELIGERDAALSAHASALARVAVLEGALRESRDRLAAFVGATAEITDCSADVEVLKRADAALAGEGA